ncbi:hypothetical protein AGE06_23915 [Salmonella enterica subsp. enterica serovar Kentucky]|nr:hypothetical protein AGE06_23915 [Salmonella enterica subsp. enterica serovar Kentucky]
MYRELVVPLIKHAGLSLSLAYPDPMGNYFHSLITTSPLTLALGFIVLILFLSVRSLQRQLSGQELLGIPSTRILNGGRGPTVRGSGYEWPARTRSALDGLLS